MAKQKPDEERLYYAHVRFTNRKSSEKHAITGTSPEHATGKFFLNYYSNGTMPGIKAFIIQEGAGIEFLLKEDEKKWDIGLIAKK